MVYFVIIAVVLLILLTYNLYRKGLDRTYFHNQTGNGVTVLGMGKIRRSKTQSWEDGVIYRDTEDGTLCAREYNDFHNNYHKALK